MVCLWFVKLKKKNMLPWSFRLSTFSGLHFHQVMELCTTSCLCVNRIIVCFLRAKLWVSPGWPLSMMVEYWRHRKTTKHPTNPHCKHPATFVQISLARTCFHQLLSNCSTLNSGHVNSKIHEGQQLRHSTLATHLWRQRIIPNETK